MSNQSNEGLDRRDFMIASIAAVGASAVLAGDADAQDSAAPPAAPTSGTVYTGDVIGGKKVVSALDIADLEPGKKHLLYFQGVEMPSGQHWYVSVIVAKGARPGKRVTLTSGVHGDEMSSIRTVQTVMGELDPAQMSGSVMAVLDIARPAVESMQRRWPDSGRGIGLIDMNREWPGDENGFSPVSRHAGLLFNRLLRPNTDLAIDFHTGTTGLEAAAFSIGDRTIPDVKTMMELFPVGLIWDDPAYPGVLHNAFVDVGIPCFTPEIGAARVLDPEMIPLFVEGTLNVLKHYGVVPGPLGRTGADAGVFIGNSAFPILATEAGLVEYLVQLDDEVKTGQKLAVQRNTFGEVVAEYASAANGRVGALRSDAMSDPGNVLGFVLFNRPAAAAQPDASPADEERTYPE
jgi:predicted deacylase